jgi:phage FluMu gp28-like protein
MPPAAMVAEYEFRRRRQGLLRAPTFPTPLAWATANARIVTPSQGVAPWDPYKYQQRLLEDRSTRRLVLKARQTGLSTAIALEALYYATHFEHDRTLFVSRNQELAGLLIRYAQVAIAGLATSVRPISESQSKLVFSNGSEIVSLPANPATGRGYPASRVYLDEFAFAEYDSRPDAEQRRAAHCPFNAEGT